MEISQAAPNRQECVSAWVYTALTPVLVIVVFRQLAGLRRGIRGPRDEVAEARGHPPARPSCLPAPGDVEKPYPAGVSS